MCQGGVAGEKFYIKNILNINVQNIDQEFFSFSKDIKKV